MIYFSTKIYISVFGWWYMKVWYDGDTALHVIPSKLTVTEAENNKKIIGSKKRWNYSPMASLKWTKRK